MIVFKNKRKIFNHDNVNIRVRIFIKIFKFNRRVLEIEEIFEVFSKSFTLFIEIKNNVLIFNNQFSFQIILRNDSIFFFNSQALNNQFSFFNVVMFIKQSHRSLTDIQTFFDEKRALIDHNDYFFDAETKMLKKITRLRVIRLINETHDVQSRVTFTHIVDTNFSIFSLNFVKFFFVINRKYIDEIFRNHFSMKNLHKLFNDYFVKQFLRKNDVNELKKLTHLLKCFEIYCQIILKFVFSKIYRKLNFFMTIYRLRLYTLLSTYIFDSMIIFHKIFVYVRICENQNNSND